MNDDLYRILGRTILFCMLLLTFTVVSGLRMVDKIIDSQIPQPVTEQVKATPALVVPTPNKGYFVQCMTGDMAIVTADDNMYYYWCNRGAWELTDDKNYRDHKLPKPQEHHAGAL